MCRTFVGVLSAFAVLVLLGCGGRGTGGPARPATQVDPSLKIGRLYRIKVDCFGGATEKALARGSRLVAAKKQAELDEMFATGELVNLEAGTRVRVEALPSAGKAKVKVVGHEQVLWIHEVWAQ